MYAVLYFITCGGPCHLTRFKLWTAGLFTYGEKHLDLRLYYNLINIVNSSEFEFLLQSYRLPL